RCRGQPPGRQEPDEPVVHPAGPACAATGAHRVPAPRADGRLLLQPQGAVPGRRLSLQLRAARTGRALPARPSPGSRVAGGGAVGGARGRLRGPGPRSGRQRRGPARFPRAAAAARGGGCFPKPRAGGHRQQQPGARGRACARHRRMAPLRAVAAPAAAGAGGRRMSGTYPAPRQLWPMLDAAEALAAGQDWDAAIAAYERILAQAPQDAYTLVQLSYVHSLAGHYRQAQHRALQAAASGVSDPALLLELLPRLRTFNQVQSMLACIQRLLPMSRMPIPLLLAVAAQLSYANLPERAIGFLDEARRADPDYPPTLLARAQVLTYLGRFDEAAAAGALRRARESAQGYWLQAWLGKRTRERYHVQAIRRELARPGRRPEDVALLGFALHKELDDLGRYDEAWEALRIGCSAKRSRLAYEPARMQSLFAALERFEPGVAPTVQADPGRVPVFIVGMHRSGTTLLEQLLHGHGEVQGLGELYDFTSAMRHLADHHCRG